MKKKLHNKTEFSWKKIILKQSATMQEAIQVLNIESLRIVLVKDDDQKLVGTITDGDIRRGLLRHLTMNAELSEFMFTQPTVASVTDDRDQIILKMQELDLLQIPIVDESGKVVGLETLHHLLIKKQYDNPVFLMAGGFGKRLRKVVPDRPKVLAEVNGRPFIFFLLDQLSESSIRRVILCTGYKSECVEDTVGSSYRTLSLEYSKEARPLGTAGALRNAKQMFCSELILVINGDSFVDFDYQS